MHESHEAAHEPASNEPVPPRCIATLGLHGSASTWVFNVVRELMVSAVGAKGVLAVYADEPSEIPDKPVLGERHLIVKTHGGPDMDAWLESSCPQILLSIRDPRDAAISMALRFKTPLQQTVQWLLRDCERMLKFASRGHRLLRYEDRFFENPQVLEQLSATLTPKVGAAARSDVFERYRPETMRQFASQLAALPAERLLKSESVMMDRVTQIHRGHIGDARSDKWKGLEPSTRRELTRVFGPFLRHFGYDLTD